MYDTLFARQAIYDKKLKLAAYELLFRQDNMTVANVDNTNASSAKLATSSVITNIFANVGPNSVVGNKNIFINFSRECLIDGIPKLLPRKRVVLEILEGMTVDEDLINAIIDLKKQGYKLALDDFVINENNQSLVKFADIIKIDVLNLNESEIEGLIQPILESNDFNGTMLAEKIESYQQFEIVKKLGFDYFQGFFLSKPMPVKGKRLMGNKANSLQLLAALNDPDIQLSDVESIISRDPKLSYRILMIVNSASFYLVRKITSLKDAIFILGMGAIKHWVMLFTLEKLSDASQEVIDRTIMRAKMCEIIAEKIEYTNKDAAYVLGLLSTLDILLNEPMEDIVEKISLSTEIIEALLYQSGELGGILRSVIAYENGCFDQLDLSKLSESEYLKVYMASLEYANWTLSKIK